jgi:signal transduction histidine kinase
VATLKLFNAERDAIISKIVCTYNHRINSPLMGIYGSLDLLSMGEQDPRKKRLIRSLNQAADRIKVATDEIAALEDYRFVAYSDRQEMIAVTDMKGKAEAAETAPAPLGTGWEKEGPRGSS